VWSWILWVAKKFALHVVLSNVLGWFRRQSWWDLGGGTVASLIAWLSVLDWVAVVLLGFTVFFLTMAIRESWQNRKSKDSVQDIPIAPIVLTELEREMLRFIVEDFQRGTVTTSSIMCHEPFLDISPRLLENSLINLRNLGYVVVAETQPFYFTVKEITGDGLKVVRNVGGGA